MIMADRQFSDLHLSAKQGLTKKISKNSFLISSTDKYDTMLNHKPPLKERVDIINKRSFEKFIRNTETSVGKDSPSQIRISKSKLFTLTSSVEDNNSQKLFRRIRPEHRATLLTTESVISSNQGFNTHRSNGSDTQASPPNKSAYYLPDRSQKIVMADSLMTLRAALDDCFKKSGMISAATFQKLLNSFESMVTDQSFYSDTMREFVSVLRKGVFFNEESRSNLLPEIHRLDEEQINSLVFLHVNRLEPTQQEVMKQMLQKMCVIKNNFKGKIADLEKIVYGILRWV